MWYGRLTGVRFDGIPRARAEHLRAPFFLVENERRSQLGPPPRRLPTPPQEFPHVAAAAEPDAFFPVENERRSQLGPLPAAYLLPLKNSRTALPQPSRMRMSNSIRFL